MWCLLRLHVIAHGAPRYQGNTTLRASGAHFQYNPFDGALCIIAWDGRLAPMAAAPTCPRLDRRELVAAVLKEGRPASLTACVGCYGWMARRAARQRKGARAACRVVVVVVVVEVVAALLHVSRSGPSVAAARVSRKAGAGRAAMLEWTGGGGRKAGDSGVGGGGSERASERRSAIQARASEVAVDA